jgi:hypothetical protein
VRARLLQAFLERVRLEDAHLLVEAVEELDVARLVGDLGAEEDALLLGGRGAHHWAELLGHALLADEERRQAVHALVALLLRDALVPVDPVLGEVDVLHAPLLALPEVVELGVGEEVGLAAIRGLHDGRIARGLEVGALRALDGFGHRYGASSGRGLSSGGKPTQSLAGRPA